MLPPPAFRLPAALLALPLFAGCVAPRASLGDIRLRPYSDVTVSPTSFSVQEGRILTGGVDLVVASDGCVRGDLGSQAVQLCPQKAPPPLEEHAQVQRWSGPSGDFTLELSPDRNKLRMDGYLNTGSAAAGLPMQATIPLGQGPQWDELRKDPVLLAIAAAVSGIKGEPSGDAIQLSR